MVNVGHPKRPRTPAQAANDQRMRERAAATKRELREATPETVDSDEVDVVLDTDDVLAKLGAALQQAGATRAQRNKQVAELEAVLSKMSAKDYPELINNPLIQQFIDILSEQNIKRHPGDPPGTIYNRGALNESKKPWQWSDVALAFPAPGGGPGDIETVELTPNETVPIIWNGLLWTIIADVQQWVPRPHYNVYMESRRARETARQHARIMFGQQDVITGIADPSVVNQSTAMVRGRGIGKTAYRPGAGGFNPYTETGEESA